MVIESDATHRLKKIYIRNDRMFSEIEALELKEMNLEQLVYRVN